MFNPCEVVDAPRFERKESRRSMEPRLSSTFAPSATTRILERPRASDRERTSARRATGVAG